MSWAEGRAPGGARAALSSGGSSRTDSGEGRRSSWGDLLSPACRVCRGSSWEWPAPQPHPVTRSVRRSPETAKPCVPSRPGSGRQGPGRGVWALVIKAGSSTPHASGSLWACGLPVPSRRCSCPSSSGRWRSPPGLLRALSTVQSGHSQATARPVVTKPTPSPRESEASGADGRRRTSVVRTSRGCPRGTDGAQCRQPKGNTSACAP